MHVHTTAHTHTHAHSHHLPPQVKHLVRNMDMLTAENAALKAGQA
jgi:hypothetical protein